MIRRIIRFCALNRAITIFFIFLLGITAWYSMKMIPIDAIPDLSDTQVIVYSKWDRSPELVEDQITYPIVSALLGVPQIKVIRGFSDYGFSFVYVLFEDGTDIYWARSRVLEYLSQITRDLPNGATTELGPDASGVGWIFQYAIRDHTGSMSIADIRSLHDFKIRYAINAVAGVSEVAVVGGYEKQYQVVVDPVKMAGAGVSITEIVRKVKESNFEVGGRLVEFSGIEYMVRSRGYITKIKDIENIPLRVKDATPLLLKHIAQVRIGPDIRRGIGELGGEGDAVSGIVVMRHGENPNSVISRVKVKLAEIQSTLPEGMEIVTVYDRSLLIRHAIDNLTEKLIEELIVVSLVILLFLWHIPSAMVPILTIPIAILLSFIPMSLMNINANLMSLAGIAISIGVLVDGAIIEVENAYKKLEQWQNGGRIGDYHKIRLEALLDVGPSVFFSLLIIAAAFLPIFTLVDQEGRLFKPLAYSKNLAMAIAALLAITFDPAVRMLFTRMEPFTFRYSIVNRIANVCLVGTYHSEQRHPVSRVLFRFYDPVCRLTLQYPRRTIGVSALLVLLTIPVYLNLGSEFMPPLYEESLLYMPTTMPGISVGEAKKLLTIMDRKLMNFPEVLTVYGKAGRANSSTDPAPMSMFETVIQLKPRHTWPRVKRFYSEWPVVVQWLPRIFFSDRKSKDNLIAELDRAMRFPGVSNAWTMPIKGRIDMLSTGMRTPIGIKIHGEDLNRIEEIAIAIEGRLKNFPGARSVFAERTSGGYFLDIEPDRLALARYGISMNEFQQTVLSAIGGEPVSEVILGRERYSINVRYPREMRDSLEAISRVFIATASGAQIPLGQVASVKKSEGPGMIRNENGFLTGYVYVDSAEMDIGGFVERAKEAISETLTLPPGYTLVWSGQYENMIRVRERLQFVVPLTLILIVILLYLNTRSYFKTFLVLTAVPFSAIGAVILLWFLDYQISIAVWVGLIALMGLDAETGVFMLLYLDLAYDEAKKNQGFELGLEGQLAKMDWLKEAVVHGAVGRVRPKMMTVLSAFIGLLPIMWSDGAGSDMMKRIAAPMVGGLATSFLLELVVYPPIYYLWKIREQKNEHRT